MPILHCLAKTFWVGVLDFFWGLFFGAMKHWVHTLDQRLVDFYSFISSSLIVILSLHAPDCTVENMFFCLDRIKTV